MPTTLSSTQLSALPFCALVPLVLRLQRMSTFDLSLLDPLLACHPPCAIAHIRIFLCSRIHPAPLKSLALDPASTLPITPAWNI